MDSSTSSTLHLAMAALVGASLMAISAFYIHKRAVDQVLDRFIQIRRKHPRNSKSHLDDEEEEEEEEEEHDRASEGGVGSDGDAIMEQQSRVSRSLDDSTVLRRYRISSSLPNFAFGNDWLEEDAKFDEAVRVRAQKCSASSLDKLNLIPAGLPPLQTTGRLGEDQSINLRGSSTRLASMGRLLTPRSPGCNTFENVEDSDEDGTELANEVDIAFSYQNIDSSADFTNDFDTKIQNSSAAPFRGDDVNPVQDQHVNEVIPLLELHGDAKVDGASAHIVGSDTILPHTILPLKSAVHDSTNIEEQEVRKMIRECLDLRKSYVYTEVAPWRKEAVAEPHASETRIDPFHFEPVEASKHHFRMEDGAVHVYASDNDGITK